VYRSDTTKNKNSKSEVAGKMAKVTFRNSAGNEVTISKSITIPKDTGKLKSPLVVLEEKEMTWEEFNKRDIKPEKIESINVLKDKSATEKYGDKGKDGVIIITLKGQNSNQKNFESQQKKFEAEQKNSEVQQKKFGDDQKSFEAQQKKFEAEQQNQRQQTKYDKVFTVVENPPYYPSGMSAFAGYIKSNMKYPKEALEKKIEGAVLIQFIVNDEGQLSDFKKLSAKGNGLEDEAIRLLKNSGNWKPGVQNGRKVTVQVQQQVVFQLPEK
ncbi:MAG: TonB family protein, partial [Bacteroidota bacterium]|nr:TonB family protein [Bacteroidota bacterium]